MSRLTPKKQKKYIDNLGKLLPDDDRKPKIINHYESDDRYLKHIVKVLEIILNGSDDEIVDAKKATRSAYTTSFILASLFLKKHHLIVEPTNLIPLDTIEKAVKLYMKISGDDDIMVRMIPSNKIGCKLYKESDIYTPVLTACKDCTEAIYKPEPGEKEFPPLLDFKSYYCPIKTMMEEERRFKKAKKEYAPNLLAITYDKLGTLKYKGMKNEFFNRVVNGAEGVLWDEFGQYLGKTHKAGMIWERAYNETLGKEYKNTNIRDEYLKIKKFIDDNRRDINLGDTGIKKTNADEILWFLETFMQPIVEIYDEMINCTKPSYHINPLFKKFLKITVKKGNYEEEKVLPRNQVLQMRMNGYSEIISYLNVSPEGKYYVGYLHDLMRVLTEEDFVVQEDQGEIFYENIDKGMGKSKTIKTTADRKSITLSRRRLLEMWGMFLFEHSDQMTFISDATLTNVDLNNINHRIGMEGVPSKKHVKVFYGDPGGINKLQTIIQYKPKGFEKLSSWKWDHDPDHVDKFMEILKRLIYSDMIDIGNTYVIAPNIEIYEDLLKDFKDIVIRTDDPDDPTKLLLTYYNSSKSRGVESDRRCCIAFGVAVKPIGVSKATILAQGDLYKHFTDDMLTKFAKEAGLTLEEIKTHIDIFTNPPTLENGDRLPPPKVVPPKLEKWFEAQARILRLENTAGDTKQGIDRCKDPMGNTPSLVIAIGITDKDLNNINHWGSDTVYDILENKRSISKDYRIEPPKVLQISDLSEIENYADMEGHDLGYDDNFSETLFNALFLSGRKSITQEEVWANYKRNRNKGIHHESESHLNGFLVGTINILRKQMEGMCIEIKNANNRYKTPYSFSLKTNSKGFDFNGYELIEPTAVEINALKILNSALNTKGKKYSCRTATHNELKLSHEESRTSKEEFRRAMDFMYEERVLEGSTWKVKDNNGSNGKKGDINGYSPEKEKINQRLIVKGILHRAD